MPNIFEDFNSSDQTDSPISTAVETPPTQVENVFSDFPMPDPVETFRVQQSQNQETLNLAKQYNVPAHEAYSLVAGPEPSMFGRLLGKVKDIADEWILRPEQVGPEVERVTRAGKEFARGATAVTAEATSKLSLGALDVIANKTAGDRSLADLVLRVTDQRAMSPEEKAKAEALGYLPAFVLPGMAVRKGLSYVPAAQWLKTILGAGLTFGSTDLALQESRKLITGEPIDWRGVHLQSGVGVLFGFGEVAVAAAMTGLAKGIEKYWGEKGIELASKIKPDGRTLQEQVALQKAEIRADVERAKETFRKTGKMPDDLMEKYVRGKPKEGSALAEKVETKAETPAQKVEKATSVPVEARTVEIGAFVQPAAAGVAKPQVPAGPGAEGRNYQWAIRLKNGEMVTGKFKDYTNHSDLAVKQNVDLDQIESAGFYFPQTGKYTTQTEEVEKQVRIESLKRKAQPAPAAEVPVAERQPWEMTQEEFDKTRPPWYTERMDKTHKEEVQEAVSDGKPVPRAVLEEYKSEKWAQEALAKGEGAELLVQEELRPETYPVQEVPVESLKLSKDVPQFKEAAKRETGVIPGEELQGQYTRLGTGAIVVWERKTGDLEVITGRHRLDLARRMGEKTIPAQVVKESEGFTREMALTLDAESNIREGQGSIRDYVEYFRNTRISEEDARARGLLARIKGQVGFVIGKSASDDVYTAFANRKLSEDKAYAIASGAPGNERAQQLALLKSNQLSTDELHEFTRMVARMKPFDAAKPKQSNLFGFDESAIEEAEIIAKTVAKEVASLKDRVLAVKGALRRPELARKMGLEFTDEESIRKEVERLENRIDDLRRVSTTPALYKEMRIKAGLEEPEKGPPKDLLGRPILQGGASGSQGEFLSKEEFKLPEADIEGQQTMWPKRGPIGKPGFDRLTPLIVEQVVNTTADVAKRAAEIASDLPKTAHFYTGRAAEVIEKHYGETGKQLARDVREIAQKAAARHSKQWDDVSKLLKPLSHEDRLKVMEIGQGRRIHITDGKSIDAETRERLKKYTDGMLEIMDRDMNEAAAVGYRRFVGGAWRDIQGSGKWFPQVLNAKGRAAMADLRQHGRANPAIQHAIEQMVAEGQAANEEDALAALMDWNNRRLRSRYGYFELPRVLLPNRWVEFDPEKVLPHALQHNAERIESARKWNIQPSEEEGLFGPQEAKSAPRSVDFAEARGMIKQIGQKYGSNHEEVLKKWLRTNFGLSNDLPEYVSDMINTLNHYQTVARLGFRIPSALRNLTQGDVNMFTAPLSAHYRALKTVILRHWSEEAQKLYDEAVRSGAVVGQKELAEVEKGPTGEERLGVAGMKMFGAAEESNHIRAALIGRFSAENHIEDLITLREGGRIEKLMQQLKYLSIDPEKYLKDLVQRRGFVNPISDEELDRILAGPLSLEDYERIMYRASVDTQFIRNIATRPIPWRTNPWLRLALKFKTFGIDQTRLLWDEVFKQAAKGTFAPMAKYFLFAVIGGEIYNVVRDILFGRDESLMQTMLERPEKRTPKDVALKLVNDFVDGAGVGILTDITYGIGNFLIGPVGQSVKNSMDALADWRHPWMSAQRFFKREFAVSRDIEGLWNRADAAFFNENNEYFDYMRWRERAFEWKDETGKGTGGKTDIGTKIEKGVKEILIGRPRYEKKISYEYAARQVTIGDVDDAAEYLAEEILDNPQKSMKEMRTSFESSMRNYAPFADISQKDLSKFLSTFSKEDQSEGRKVQQEWIERYQQAISKAMKIASEKE